MSVLTQVLININFVAYIWFALPAVNQHYGPYSAVGCSMLMFYLFLCIEFTHFKTWLTEPGYPERVATATGVQKVNFEKKKLRNISNNLKQLITKRNKGFVALLNSDQPSFTNQQNQCFKCTLKPLKPYRSYHCSICERDIIYMDHHCIFANNCIGLYNLRYYLGLVLYASIALGMIVYSFVRIVEAPKKVSLEYYCFNFFLCTDLGLFVFMLPYCFWSWNLALNGKTHIEQRKGLFHGHNFCYAKKDKENPYGLDSAMEQHYS